MADIPPKVIVSMLRHARGKKLSIAMILTRLKRDPEDWQNICSVCDAVARFPDKANVQSAVIDRQSHWWIEPPPEVDRDPNTGEAPFVPPANPSTYGEYLAVMRSRGE